MKLQKLKPILTCIAISLFIQSTCGQSSLQLSSDENARTCGCPTRAQVNVALNAIGNNQVSDSTIAQTFQQNQQTLPSTICTSFYEISNVSDLPLLINGTSFTWCTFKAASSKNCAYSNCYTINTHIPVPPPSPSTSHGECPMVPEPVGQAPIMVYNKSALRVSCLDNAPNSTASIISDAGDFLGKSMINPNQCIYQNVTVDFYR